MAALRTCEIRIWVARHQREPPGLDTSVTTECATWMRNGLIIAAIVLAVGAVWLFGGRQIVLMLDALATADHAPPVSAPVIVVESGWLRIGDTPLSLARDGESQTISIDAADGAPVVLHADGKDFTLGTIGAREEPYNVVVTPDPGDTVSYTVTHSVIAWPTPLELNFMTGKSPGQKRNVYYTLTWQKQNGAELELVWRYEQWCYEDWASATMINTGATGLIRTTIRPAAQ